MEGYQLGGGKGKMGGNVQELRSTNWQVQNRHGGVQNTVENGVAKEFTCMTHRHVLRAGGIAGGHVGYQVEGSKGENWDYYNIIINQIYFLK